jgi:hypothetical protein
MMNSEMMQITRRSIQETRSWNWDEEDTFYAACGAALKYAEEQGQESTLELRAAIESAVRQEMSDHIIDYARQIAVYRGYDNLVNGLQPLDVLEAKYQHELEELREAFTSWQSGQDKTQWHVLHEATDVYYYSRQIEAQSGQSLWPVAYASIRHYLPAEWGEHEIREAADAKYGWRASGPGNKDEAYELHLIQERIAQRGE